MMNSMRSTHLPLVSLLERVVLMNEATALGAGSLAGSVCSLNQKSPLKNFPYQNASQ